MAEEITGSADVPPAGEAIHLPGPSYMPAILALGLTIAICGVVINWVMCGIGVAITVYAIVRWSLQTRRDIADLPLEH